MSKQTSRRPTIYSQHYRTLLASLVAARQSKGLTQVRLAGRLRMTQSMLSKYERGELRLDVLQLRDWCKAIGVDFLTLLKEWDKQSS
ncbi:MAG: helix-turn-helix transcriptional regulator [Phycisphaerales bacterium]|nr:helix-turn-helix transcriptional regulator [Phycisphaerales bacterium]